MALSRDQLNEAIGFNITQGFTVEQVKLIQRVVGTTCDGVWGPKTVQAIYDWQSQNGVSPDGKIWNDPRGNTWPPIHALASQRFEEADTDPLRSIEPVTIGCWVDDDVRIKKPESFERMSAAGISAIALMLDTSKKGWDPMYAAHEIEAIARLADDHDMEIIFTTWPFPDKGNIDVMCDAVGEWLASIAPEVIRAFEVDAEFNWKPRFVRGFDNIDKAGDYLVKKMDEAVAATGARKELTTFTSHTENGRAADVAPHMDRVLGQAHSVRHRKKSDGSGWRIPWTHSYGPGRMQKLTLDRSLRIPGMLETIELGCGLAAYDQEWPRHRPEEAMKVAYDAAIGYGCREIRYWSFKWIFGHLSNTYAERFLQSARVP